MTEYSTAGQPLVQPQSGIDLEQRLADLPPDKLAALHKRLLQKRQSLQQIRRLPDKAYYPLSFHQQRLWFIEQLQPETPLYNVSRAMHLRGPLNYPALKSALQTLLDRHEALRTTFHVLDGEPLQRINASSELELPIVDLQADSTGTDASLDLRLSKEGQRIFDLATDLQFRAILFRLADDQYVLQLTIHHLACDGWSLRLLFNELAALYRGFHAEQLCELPPAVIRYVDFARWQREPQQQQLFAKRIQWWQRQLAEAPPVLDLATDKPRPLVSSGSGSFMQFDIPTKLREQLESLARREGLTLYMILLSGFFILLHRYTGMEKFLVGTASAGRHRPETQTIVGFFVDTVVLKADLSGDPAVRDVLQRVRQTVVDAVKHGDVPFDRIVESLDLPRDLSRHGLFQVLFNAPPQYELNFDGLEATPFKVDMQTARFDLEMTFAEGANKTTGMAWSTDLFDTATIKRMLGHYAVLLRAIATSPGQPVRQMPLLTEPERLQLLVQWNDTAEEFPDAQGIHNLFEQQVERTPEADAVIFGSEKLTYRELNQRANQLAHYLLARGVGPESLVGVCLERSPELIVSILGILKAGGAYVPLDPGYPQKRLDTIVEDTGIHLMLTQPDLAIRFTGVENILPGDTEAYPQDNPDLKGNPDQLAYIIFTSGSSGRPKGVMIEQHALVNFILAAQRVVQLDHSARLLSVTTISFDIFALELFLPLQYGASMILASRETAMDGHALAKLLSSSRATHLQATPITWQMLADVDWRPPDVFTGLCGGELLTRELAHAITQRCTRLWNWYGPTEATVWATVLEVSATDYSAGNIGKPLSNYRTFILDGANNPVPIGVVGELAIGGDSLARGYFNQPELTAAQFSELGALGRVYRTGDRARWHQNGQIEFLGRADQQVKVRGFRIEPGDIEATLLQHPYVSAAVVRVVGAAENKKLAAYITARSGLSKETLGQLREHVKQYLPDYMCPTSYTLLERFPLTPNGKVDRQALPDPDESRLDLNDSYVAPQTPLQQQLTEIWADVLGVNKVGIRDDFFELGGHSLLVLRLIARMEPVMGEKLSLLNMFQNPSIEEITRKDVSRESDLPEAVTAIRATGSLAPFFAIGSHPRYAEVARQLDPEQPFYRMDVYALLTRQLFESSGMLQSVEAIAAHFVSAILSIQPRGPYYIGGGCEGSLVAFEVARMLQQRGEEVAQLALWITPAPGFQRGAVFGKSAFTRVLHLLRYQMAPELIADLNLRTLREAIRHARIEYRIFRAMDRYKPACRFEGSINLVRTAEHGFGMNADRTLGWGEHASGGVQVHVVPGNHDTWLLQFASEFGDVLEKILRPN